MDNIRTCIHGAFGAMTFGVYHQFTTNKIMELNNEKIKRDNEKIHEKIIRDNEKINEKIKRDNEKIHEKLNLKIDQLHKDNEILREYLKKSWWQR